MERYHIVDLEQGSEAWHKFRERKIGASMAPIIMGVSPYKTKLQLWEDILLVNKPHTTYAMKRGTDMESKARDWMNAQPGLGGIYKPVVIQSIAHPDIIASLDGYYVNEGRIHILEIKCPGMQDHLTAIGGEIPDHYYPQLQHQMDLAGVDSMLYLSFDGDTGVVVPCFRDEYYCATLFAEELSFYASILSGKSPEATERDWLELDDAEDAALAEDYICMQRIIDNLTEEQENRKKIILERVDHPLTRIGSLKIQKIVRKGGIDYERLLTHYEIHDTEKYRKPSIESYRFTFSSS